MNFDLSHDKSGFFVIAFLCLGFLTIIVHIGFAIGVHADASDINDPVNRRKTCLVGTFTWTIATLLGGVFVAAIYWLMHHSTLSPDRLNKIDENS